MNLVFVCSSLNGGGAERVAVNLANSMVGLGHTVTIFLRKNLPDSYQLDSRVNKRISNFHSISGQILSLKRLIDSEHKEVLVSFTDVPNIIAFIALKVSKIKPVFIPTVHTNLRVRDERQTQGVRFKIIRYLHKHACHKSSYVVGVSEGGCQELVDYYKIDKKKVVSILNPVIDNAALILSTKPYSARKKVKLVAAGRLTEAKNYFLMLDIIKKLNAEEYGRYCLDIYGEGELASQLYEYAEALSIIDLINFKGFETNLKDKLSNYDLFLFTSDWEGFGNVLVEALCAGLPVISTDCPSGPREILAGGKFGRLLPVGDVDAFCTAVKEEIRTPLKISNDDLVMHLNSFRGSVVAQKYIDLVKNAKRS
uniref:glycosyltransferase n=1 Tax=uncultured Halomonas sp. TaxID=173971 RepID=UPI002602218B|nr:glycosyltransferase [uncultured Halomonas sp.]